MDELIGDLERIVGSSAVINGDDLSQMTMGFWNSPVRAKAIIRPRSTQQVSEVMKRCATARQRVVVWGGGTGLVAGVDTAPGDIVLSTEAMTKIESIDVSERCLTVQAGCVLQVAQDAVGKYDLQLPIDLGARGSCTIGGNVATNAGGINVVQHGMTRDQVLGLEVVLADGTVLSSMQPMIKNNAGLDLKQIFVGSEGTLGIVTRVILRLTPVAANRETAMIACQSFQDLPDTFNFIAKNTAGSVASFEVLWGDYYEFVTRYQGLTQLPLSVGKPYYALIEIEHSCEPADPGTLEMMLTNALESGIVTDAALATSLSQRDQMWAIREDTEAVSRQPYSVIFDVSLRISDMASYVAQLRENLNGTWPKAVLYVWGHLADGNLHLAVLHPEGDDCLIEQTEHVVYGLLQQYNGSVSAEHGIGLLKRPYLSYSRTAQEIALMKQIKRMLDPHNLLNPGKLLDMDESDLCVE